MLDRVRFFAGYHRRNDRRDHRIRNDRFVKVEINGSAVFYHIVYSTVNFAFNRISAEDAPIMT